MSDSGPPRNVLHELAIFDTHQKCILNPWLGTSRARSAVLNLWATALAALAIVCGVLGLFIAVLGKVSHVWS